MLVCRVLSSRRYESGTLPVPADRLGRLIMVGEPVTGTAAGARAGWTVAYARVSSVDQNADLDRQVARVTVWATGQKLGVDRVVTEVGSALKGHREKFLELLRDPTVSTIVVEPRDRFARFGAEYVGAALTAQGRRLLLADRWYPSAKTCSGCGAVKAKLALHEREYQCQACGLVIDRDRNAALNLAALAGEFDTAGSGPAAARGADQKTRTRGQVAAKREPGTTTVGQTGTVPPQGRTTDRVLTKAH
ncbi:IS607 family transposase [Micromonospora sp. WMMD1076]|uniref:IS607 family transposase n=1 Tax=Micromonospora sp. WMMD1076 TaxID=3016103 RepID=UPI00249A72A3|nr:IS607 family transposase [Micromonospora sp. WMMD1076]WFF10005.1 IS607 family transposase [Micromonospora sp. WMMD1076]